MKALDFMVVSELFMTETAKLADIVLPACSFLEKSGVGYVYGVNTGIPFAIIRKKVIEPIGESMPDWKIWTEIANRMGYQDFFPWNKEEEVIDYFLKPSGMTREQLEIDHPEGVFYADIKYERPDTGLLREKSSYIPRPYQKMDMTPYPIMWSPARAR